MLNPQGPTQPLLHALRLPSEPTRRCPQAGVHAAAPPSSAGQARHPGKVGHRMEVKLSAPEEPEVCREVMPVRPTVCWSHRE